MNQEKLEENIINTNKNTDKKMKKSKKIFVAIITGIVLSILIVVTLFVIDVNRMKNNKPVFFSTWGYKYAPTIDFQENEIELAIKDYLILKGDNEEKHHDNEKTFVSMRIYLFEEKENNKLYNVYAWVNTGKYYLENGEIKQDSESSIPHKFIVEKQNDKFVVINSKIPRDGSYYKDDMKNIFPLSVRNDMKTIYIDGTNNRLQLDIEEQVKLYFHK
ncbi:MAG: hypothetical protein Q4E28_01490 [Clostridia bacterium]|nr:hypothetical protein [Clostridia bacterium]